MKIYTPAILEYNKKIRNYFMSYRGVTFSYTYSTHCILRPNFKNVL